MGIQTMEEDYEYRMKEVVRTFVHDYDLKDCDAETLQNRLWDEYAVQFAHAVLGDMADFSGDELFEAR